MHASSSDNTSSMIASDARAILRLARTEIDRLDLLDHDEARQRRFVRNGDVEGKVASRIGNRAHDGKPRVLVEKVVAHDQRRPATLLLVA